MRAIGFHWHAVQRDLLALGFRAADAFTPRLSASEFLSVICAAPSPSALHYSFTEGWSITDHLLATMSEQQGGLVRLDHRHPRPGVTSDQQPKQRKVLDPNTNRYGFEVLSLDEFRKRKGA